MKKNWKEALAAMGITPKAKKEAQMVFEVDDANGTKLTFPDISDLTEIAEGVAVTAADGEYVFEADGNTYTVTVAGNVVTAVTVVPTEAPAAAAELDAQTAEAMQAIADELQANTEAREALQLDNTALRAELTTLRGELNDFKALMSHGGDDNEQKQEAKKPLVLAGKKIDLSKLNK